ncbi:MAG TPA: autotransporter-associated beta strand repeat-containing protein, partial [Tepidisphaeraceae bacterium]|nr:autotransporter-associated beta strand repeat-containing protein [Tepidisphaeraceae bacterium]
ITLNANGGNLALLDLNNFSDTVGGVVASSTTFGSATIRTGATGVLTLNGNLTLNNNRNATGNTNREVLVTGTGVYGTATPSGTLDLGGAVRTITASTNNTQANNGVTIETVIQNGGIIKAGNTTLLLRNANTFAGGLTVNSGNVDFAADNNLGAAANVITLAGGGLVYNNNVALTFGRVVNITNANSELGVNQNVMTISAADRLQSTVATTITKSGAGTLAITAAQPNLNAAAWRVTGGVLQVSAPSMLGGGATPNITLAGGTARIFGANTAGAATAGVNGWNGFFYNFGNNPQSNSAQFATDQLLLAPRVITQTQTDPFELEQVTANLPRTPVVGFHQQDNMGMMYKGLLNITTGGSYTFQVAHDDHASLFIDGQEVLANAGNTANNTTFRSVSVNLAGGAHSVVLKFTQGTGGRYLRAQYAGADTGGATTFRTIGQTAGTVTNGSLAAVTYGNLVGSGTLDIYAPSTASTFSLANGQTFTLTSPTIDNLTVTGASTLDSATTAAVLAPTSGGLIFNGAIGQTTAGSRLTVAGPYLTRFNAANTYTGITTVTGGRLELNATGGNAIAGDLDLNAANTAGLVANVQLLQSNQIADTSAVTVRNLSVLDLKGFSDTIGALSVQGSGQIIGSGTLTTTGVAGQAGRITANLAGTGGLTKTTAGELIVAGTNTYAGLTDVQAGTLTVLGNSLGASGVGNGTTVTSGAQLRLQSGLTTAEAVTVGGSGISAFNPGAIRNVNSTNTLTTAVTLSADTVLQSDAGNLVLGGGVTGTDTNLTLQGAGDFTLGTAAALGTGTLTKDGAGALVFAYDVGGTLPTMTFNAGVLGFKGTQSMGTVTVGSTGPAAATTWRFDSDPGAGTSVYAPTGTTVIGNFNVNQTFLGRLDGSSGGVLALGQSTANALDMTSFFSLRIGAAALAGAPVTVSGTITPGGSGYRFGGGGGELRVASELSGANNVDITGPGTVYLTRPNTFVGSVGVDGSTLRVVNNDSLGAAGNVITLQNGGTLSLINNVAGVTNGNTILAGQLGNATVPSQQRQIYVGSGGGTIAVEGYSNFGNGYILSGADPLAGFGTLTKTQFGALFIAGAASFNGPLVLAQNGGVVETRGIGSLANVASVELNNGSLLVIDNVNGLGTRQFANAHVANRLNDSAPVTFQGGELRYRARNTAAQTTEAFGEARVLTDHSIFRLEVNGQGGDATFTNLVRNIGQGTIRFENNAGTFGATGNNPRITFAQINGGASSTTNLIGGWAFNNNNGTFDWAGYNATTGVVNSTYTGVAQGATPGTAFTPTAGTVVNLTAADATNAFTQLSDSGANAHDLLALRFASGFTQTLNFADANDTLFVESGGILSNNVNNPRNIGSATVRGKLTAGSSTAGAGAKELFVHVNQNTLAIESIITDNNGAVSLVKDTGGTLELRAANTYSGGTNIYGGRINVTSTGGLGSGPVQVVNSALELRAAGSTSSTSGIVGRNQSEIYLQNGAVTYNGAGDAFTIEAGSTITGTTTTANRSIGSLTRVASSPGAGQIVLAPDSIVRATDAFNGDIMTNMIANLGTNADLYYNQSGGFDQNQYITIGAGTAWKGISSSVGTGWSAGTIYANSDFHLQGLRRNGGNVALTLGANISTGTYSIINQAGRPISAFVSGQVQLNEDVPVDMSSDLTFVVGKDAILQPNQANSFGNFELYGRRAGVLVQAGGTVDPGNY